MGQRMSVAAERILVPPHGLHGVSQTHRIAQEEIFGPVLSVLTFRTPGEAVAKANNTPYGLSAGVGPRRLCILWMADQIRAGGLGQHLQQIRSGESSGGYKESGYGREGGRQGLAAYVVTEGAR